MRERSSYDNSLDHYWTSLRILRVYDILGHEDKSPVHGSLEIADGDDGESPYVFMQIDVPPNEFKTGDVVCLCVHKIVPRN